MVSIARRQFVTTLAAAWVAPALPAGEFTGPRYVGCRVEADGRHLASIFDESGCILHDVPLPGRGHGFAVQPGTGRVVVFARRPGGLVQTASLNAWHRRLSIRHLDMDRDARIVVAMQHEGHRLQRVPLIAFARNASLVPAYAPEDVGRGMRRYTGSASFDASGRYAAITHPHDGIVSVWSARSARLLSVTELADTCGVAPGTDAGSFIATGAHGQIMRIDARSGESTLLSRSDGTHWDNHLVALPGVARACMPGIHT